MRTEAVAGASAFTASWLAIAAGKLRSQTGAVAAAMRDVRGAQPCAIYSLRGSNPRPMAHKTIALTTELRELDPSTSLCSGRAQISGDGGYVANDFCVSCVFFFDTIRLMAR